MFRSHFINLPFRAVRGSSTTDAVMRHALSKNTVDDRPPKLTCCLQIRRREGWTSTILNVITRLTAPGRD